MIVEEKLFVVQLCICWRNSESHRSSLQGNSEKFHCNPKEFQKGEVVVVLLLREEKASSCEKTKFLQVAPNCAALTSCVLVS